MYGAGWDDLEQAPEPVRDHSDQTEGEAGEIDDPIKVMGSPAGTGELRRQKQWREIMARCTEKRKLN